MGKRKYYTPDGVSDILPEECSAKREIESKLRNFFSLNGYEEIETPGIEFYDVYSAGEGFAPQEGMFKFFDDKGRILSLRYDGTVPVARVASTLLKDTKPPLRFSYIGNMYRYNETGGGKQREFTQAGVELMGSSNPGADAQIISLAIESALLLGISDLQVSLGNVEFFKGIMEEWDISYEFEDILTRLIDGKETVAIEDFADGLGLPANAKKVLMEMTSSSGTFEFIEYMRGLAENERSIKALDNLHEVLCILEDMGLLKYVSLDLGMLQSLDYYTGTIFKGFTYGIGFPLFSGGRYDNVAGEFGRDLSSTGFSIGVNFAMNALRRQNKSEKYKGSLLVIGYEREARKKAFDYAKKMRGKNIRTEIDCTGGDAEYIKSYAESKGIENAVFIDGENKVLEL